MPGAPHSNERLILRELNESDRADFIRINERSRDLFGKWAPLLPPGQSFDAEFTRQFERAARGREAGTERRFVGVLDGEAIGFFNIFQIVRGAFENASASWSVNAEQCGRGLGTEGVGRLLDFAFAAAPDGLGLHRVAAAIIPTNLASIRVAEKNGFRREGLGKNYVRIAGEWQDHLLFAKLADEHLAKSRISPPSTG